MLQRDALIKTIHEAAQDDEDIVFLSADFGAEALDGFRAQLPKQFMHCGISEAHMIDMAAGLALAGKKVFTYCMGPFYLRAYEQAKQVAIMDLPITMIGAGIGLGYADSGPTHYATEDLACMRALNNIEVYTPADVTATKAIGKLCLEEPKLRYLRLDREALPDIYKDFDPKVGLRVVREGTEVAIASCGYMLHRCLQAVPPAAVVDVYQIKHLNLDRVRSTFEKFDAIVTVEEQCGDAGFGSAICEVVNDVGLNIPVNRLDLPDRYFFENGGRAHLLDTFGLSVDDIEEACNWT